MDRRSSFADETQLVELPSPRMWDEMTPDFLVAPLATVLVVDLTSFANPSLQSCNQVGDSFLPRQQRKWAVVSGMHFGAMANLRGGTHERNSRNHLGGD